jgi:type IV pilus assembly protein PilO
MELSLSYSGNFSSLMSLIKNIESFSKKIIIKNINIGSGQDDMVSGTMILDFYAIPKLSSDDENYLTWTLNGNYGKDNPFYSTAITSSAPASAATDFDFLMSVRPISSDLPTIMLGKAKDSSKSTYIYDDNPGVENVEVYLTKQDNKYYFKYKAGNNSYPAQYSSAGTEFAPSGDSINFKIYSVKRNSTSDMSGANIKIINKTDKAVNIVIDGDDDERPRINASGDWNVSVKNEK